MNMTKACVLLISALLLPVFAAAEHSSETASPKSETRLTSSSQAEGDIWGYYAGKEPLNDYFLIGAVKGMEISFWGDETISGAQITAIRIAISNEKDARIMENGTVWIAEDLESGTKVREVPVSNVVPGDYTEVVLPEPYTIPASRRVYIGCSWPENIWINAIAYKQCSFSTLEHYGEWRYNSSTLPGLQIRLKNHHLPRTAAQFKLTDYEKIYVIRATNPGKESPVIFHLHNDGIEAISSIDYTVIVDDKEQHHHLDVQVPSGQKMARDVAVPITGSSKSGQYNVVLRIDKVNGKENALKDKVTSVKFQNQSRQVERHTVMELQTNIKHPDYTSDYVALELARKTYGDRFIGIVSHFNDPMQDMDRELIYDDISRFGSCARIDWRYLSFSVDQGFFNAYYDTFAPTATTNQLEEALNTVPSVDVQVKGRWNADKTEVNATCEVERLVDDTKWSYVDFFLVADNVRGEGSDWGLVNGFWQMKTDDPNLEPYVKAPYRIDNVVYNGVKVGRHIGESLGGTSEDRKRAYTSTIALNIPESMSSAIDEADVYIVAVVYENGMYGPIANAAKAKVEEYDVTDGISMANNRVRSSGVYTIGGQLVQRGTESISSLPRGFYVVNGKKVVISK